MDDIIRNIDHWDEFLDFYNRSDIIQPNLTSDSNNYSFTKTNNLAEAIDKLKNGDPKLNQIYEQKKNLIDLSVNLENSISSNFDLIGDIPDVGLYNEGNPECMIQFTYQRTKPGILKIAINTAASAVIDTEDIQRRGLVCASLIDSLETLGYRCHVFITQTVNNYRRDKAYQIQVPFKEPNQSLDINRLLFVTSHPSFLRRIIFRYEEEETNSIKQEFGFTPHGSFGFPTPLIGEKQFDFVVPEISSLNGIITKIYSNDKLAYEWLVSTIKTFEDRIKTEQDQEVF